MTVVHLPHGPTAYFKLTSVELTKKIFGHARATPHHPELILNNFATRLGHTLRLDVPLRYYNDLLPYTHNTSNATPNAFKWDKVRRDGAEDAALCIARAGLCRQERATLVTLARDGGCEGRRGLPVVQRRRRECAVRVDGRDHRVFCAT